MSQDSTLGKGSESTVNGNGHSRTVPDTVPSILRTVISEESESSSEAPRRTGLPLGSSIRGATSQPEPTVIAFAELKDESLAEVVEDAEDSQQTLLAVWKNGSVSYHRQINCDGRQLIPMPRTGEIMQHVRLPRGVKPYESVSSLILELSNFIERCVSIKDDDLLPLLSFVFASWLIDRLPIAPYLSVTGLPESGKTTLLRTLRLVCRWGFLLATNNPAGVYQRCGQLMPTLLVDDCDPERSRELRQLLRTGTTRDVPTMRNNKLFSTYGMKVIAWNEPPDDLPLITRCVQIEMVETNKAGITDEEMEQKASELRAQLLQFRFDRYKKIQVQAVSGEDRLRPRSRDLFRCLVAPCADAPMFCEYLGGFFRERDILRREALPRPEGVVLAELFSQIHQRPFECIVLIKDLTDRVNKILKENGEHLRLHYRKIGAVLTSFGISPRKRTSYGYEILLDERDQLTIHKLAKVHGLDDYLDHSVRIMQRECRFCAGGPLENGTEDSGSGNEHAVNTGNT
jgi:hypothetical protein